MDVQPYTADDALLRETRQDGTTRVRLYRPAGTVVVLGRGSNAEIELDLEACLADDVPLERRRGGGCAVVLDPGNLIVTAARHAPGIGDNARHFARLTRWLIGGLTVAGVAGVRQAGISDLALGDRKVGGACLHRGHDTLLYAVSLLVEPDLTKITRYLLHPPREPDYRRSRLHAEFLDTLGPRIGPDATRTLHNRLKGTLTAATLDRVMEQPDA